ncbi:MAG: deoxyuridine 5'-triphosphate nucleotidohydrolase [Pyrodictiaceae archaeon]
MFVPGHLLAKLVSPIEEEQVQPAGVDLRIAEVRLLDSQGILGRSTRSIPAGRLVEPEGGWWRLSPGAYRIRFLEAVRIPEDHVGFCLPRSSLIRMGALISCAVWDPGYHGRGEALLVVVNPQGVRIEVHARIAQLVLAKVEPKPIKTYKGVYQGEGLGSAHGHDLTSSA